METQPHPSVFGRAIQTIILTTVVNKLKTRAMAAGVTERLWSIEDIVKLVD